MLLTRTSGSDVVPGAAALLLVCLFATGSTVAAQRGRPTAVARPPETERPTPAPETYGALVDRYCIGCHNERLKSGGMTLQQFDLRHVEQNAPLAEKVIRKLRAGLMPPAGANRPDHASAAAFAASLETAIDAAAQPNPGWRAFQRLNRSEYARSIHDLLALDVDVTTLLPPDPLSAGFDNIADAQSFSPAVLEGYIRAAGKVAAEALGDPSASATSATYTVPSTVSQMRQVDGAPFGSRGGIAIVHNFPADGEYVFSIRFQAATNGGLIGRRSANEQIEVSINGERLALLDIKANMSESTGNGLNVRTGRLAVKAGPQRVAAAFLPKFSGLVDDLVAPIEFTLADAIGAAQLLQVPHLQDLNITGPFTVTGVSETPSRRRVLTCRPVSAAEERTCASEIVANLARRAYRRPVTEEDLTGLLAFYESGRNSGGETGAAASGNFEAGIRTALQAILASPHFVFRLEQRPANVSPGESYRVGDLELASRLSYFLWSSAPDDQLLAAARDRKLRDPAAFEPQVRRMLADPRSEALATRFAAQWLHLAELDNMVPDALLYPNFDHLLAKAMRRETELFFDSVVREDRNILDLLTADYTFVNERLALHYKIPGILGSRFRRVAVTDDYRRGLLGQGSILTMTSNADRTSPVIRGKWVMEVLLGTPPPPPPPNVPGLDATKPIRNGQLLTVRERLEAHRANPACASCHRMIDPIGLSLENFDVTGSWRIKDSGVPIDSTAVLFDGTVLTGPVSLRRAVLNYSDAFVSNLTENLLTYALGRRVEYYDMPSVRAIARDAARQDNRFSAFVLGIVKSPAFQMSRAETAVAQR